VLIVVEDRMFMVFRSSSSIMKYSIRRLDVLEVDAAKVGSSIWQVRL